MREIALNVKLVIDGEIWAQDWGVKVRVMRPVKPQYAELKRDVNIYVQI